jgi:cystathionine beta-lyase/cystathionine gamma-synthase
MPEKKRFATRAIHVAARRVPVASDPVSLPIYQTAAFSFDSLEGMARTLHEPEAGFNYTRVANPTTDALERAIADLEETESSVAFASGMAAIHAVLTGVLSAGDHVVAQASLYGNTFALLKQLARFGIETTFVDGTDPAAVKAGLRRSTKLVYAESISNPTLRLADVPALAEIAHAGGALLAVDATFASPYLSRPVELGADLSLHSATKYLGGHGDLIAGVVSGKKEPIAKVRRMLIDAGGVMAPLTSWLILRGLKTLELRMERHCRSSLKIAQWLSSRRGVKQVMHPGLESHPQHALAKRLLPRGAGGMVGFDAGGKEAAVQVQERLKLFTRAASLGDAHSLALQPSTTSHRQLSADELAKAGIPEGYVRLSIGLEDPDDLIADLDQAL